VFDGSEFGSKVKPKLKSCGVGVTIYPLAKIIKPEVIEIGDHTEIDDFVFINGGQGISIGRYNHVSWFISIIGGGSFVTGDYVSLGAGVRVITGTDHYKGGKRISPLVPLEHRSVYRCSIVLEKDVFIGSNAVIQPRIANPNLIIGEGAIIGSNSLVTNSVEPWSINVGSPCRKVGERPRVTVPDL
jgi:galactoside O-acetyltransferase